MGETYYITHVSLGHWPITSPKRTEKRSLISAQNQVCNALLEDMGVRPPPSSEFRAWMLKEYGWKLIEEAMKYIGVTIEVELNGQKPREFRKEYCTTKLEDGDWPSLIGSER
jgi:hypothetical protein